MLYVNTAGTFGVSSAGYWWSRLAALLLRVIYVLLGADHRANIPLFSDDGFRTGVGPAFHKTISLVFLIQEIFSVPLSWKKVEGCLDVDWEGTGSQARRLGEAYFPCWPGTSGKALLGAMYAWTPACPLGAFVRMPLIVNLTLRWLHRLLSRGAWRAGGAKKAAGEVFRINGEDGSLARSRTSALPSGSVPESRERQAPWAFEAGIPSG